MHHPVVQNNATVPAESCVGQLDRLLQEQITAARKGNLAEVERLGRAVDEAIAKAGPSSQAVRAALGPHRGRVERLCSELSLILSTERAEVAGQLQKLRTVKRAVEVYGGTGPRESEPPLSSDGTC
jgi:hypothetical protein